jgi:hypothetical protein
MGGDGGARQQLLLDHRSIGPEGEADSARIRTCLATARFGSSIGPRLAARAIGRSGKRKTVGEGIPKFAALRRKSYSVLVSDICGPLAS